MATEIKIWRVSNSKTREMIQDEASCRGVKAEHS